MVRECDCLDGSRSCVDGRKNVGAPTFWCGLHFCAPWTFPEQHDSFGRTLTRGRLRPTRSTGKPQLQDKGVPR